MKKTQIRNAIVSEPFVIGNGWKISISNGTKKYIDVFEKTYPNKTSVLKVATTLSLDDNQKGRNIRLYVCIRFTECFPTQKWLDDYFACTLGENIPGFYIERRNLRSNATKSGNAIHAILEGEDWTKWSEQDLQRNLQTLRECSQKLCQWTDKYVSTLA